VTISLITIHQQYKEELSLYRNGATNQDLMEIINEKETELSTTKQALTEKSESLRKVI
jgi:hypothetical protein